LDGLIRKVCKRSCNDSRGNGRFDYDFEGSNPTRSLLQIPRTDSVVQALAGTTFDNPSRQTLEQQASLNFGTVSAHGMVEQPVPFTGARVGDAVAVSPHGGLAAGLTWAGYVSAPNEVKVRLTNVTGADITLGSTTWSVGVIVKVV